MSIKSDANTPVSSLTSTQRSDRRRRITAALICLIVATTFRTLTHIDEEGKPYRPIDTGIQGGQWLAGMLLGFRVAVADMMWIRVDQYFHDGRYDKIMPLCYIITAMDPGWIDVYTTGSWHLGYNFGDRRLVPAAIAFDQRGVNNNPLNYDMRYELGWMELSRGYQFKEAARDFGIANQLGLKPVGKTHAWPHGLEASGDVDGAIAAWKTLESPTDPIPLKQVNMLLLRQISRKNLGEHPIDVHMDIKVTRKGPRSLEIEGVTNLPKYSKVFYEFRDADWAKRSKESLAKQMSDYTLYSQTDTTLEPSMGIFRGEQVDFYKGILHVHEDDKKYEQFPSEPVIPGQDGPGHMVLQDGYFKGTVDMAKIPSQYPLHCDSYELRFFVDPRMEPINTQDIIGWNGEGMAGPLIQKVKGYNMLVWTHVFKKSEIDPKAK